jgi:hypothetical protein
MTPRLALAAAVLALAGCGARIPETPVAAQVSDPALTVSDSAALTAGDATATITLTLTCATGYTAFGSVAITENTSAGDLGQFQGYSGLLKIPCTGQPQEVPGAVTSARTPFREGPALFRAGFTLGPCDAACPWVYVPKTITLARAPGQAPALPAPRAPRERTAPGEAKP